MFTNSQMLHIITVGTWKSQIYTHNAKTVPNVSAVVVVDDGGQQQLDD